MLVNELIDISERMRPYLSIKARQIMDNRLMSTVHEYEEEGKRKCVLVRFMNVMIKRTLPWQMIDKRPVPNEQEIKHFAGIVSVMADKGVIGWGCLGGPFALRLHNFNEAADRVMMAFYAPSLVDNAELQKMCPAFKNEGELGDDLNTVFQFMKKNYNMELWSNSRYEHLFIEGRAMKFDQNPRIKQGKLPEKPVIII